MKKRRATESYEGYDWHKSHKEELKEKARQYRAAHPEYLKRNADKAKRDRLAQPEYFKAREFAREMKKYGTSVEWYRDKLIEQLGVCALCAHLSRRFNGLQRLQVDHDHSCCDVKTKSCGKCLRGLLCGDCNVLLSYLEKFLEQGTFTPHPGTWTEKAMEYLDRYKWQHAEESEEVQNLLVAVVDYFENQKAPVLFGSTFPEEPPRTATGIRIYATHSIIEPIPDATGDPGE